MRKLTYLLVLLLSMLLFGCGKAQDKTVISYCKALEAGKYDEAASYLSKDARKALDQSGGMSLLAAAGSEFKQHQGIKKIDITKRQVSGNSAMVSFIYRFNDGITVSDYFPLVKEGTEWKITK